MAKYTCFCNECGHKKETDNVKEFEFCPVCNHVNTGFTDNERPKVVRKLPEIQLYKPTRAEIEQLGGRARELAELSKKLYYRFVELNKAISVRPCYNWVKLGRSKYHRIDGRYKIFLDHGVLLTCEDNRRIFVSQPYSLPDKEIEKIEIWAGERGLKVEVDRNNSWHYPGRTILLTFEIGDLKAFEAYLDNNTRESVLGSNMLEVE